MWKSVDETLPTDTIPVLAVLVQERYFSHPVRIIVRAFYVARHSVSADNYEGDDADYDEEEDRYYTPEGWYECNILDEIHYRFSDHVTHWAPLPELPDIKG